MQDSNRGSDNSVNWGNEANMIEEIASDVLGKLVKTPSKDSEDFVGIEDHIAEMSVLLELESEEVRMVGLCGFSGIGKTTVARVLFQRLSRHFRGSIFIDRAFVYKSMEIFGRANRDDYNMKLHLQRNFLSEILGKGDVKINHLSAVGERLKNQKVLIFVDDFNDQVVLDALVGQTQWFGSGSRIVVVTNNKQFLRAHGIVHIYEVYLPSEKLAVEMLCRYAFRKNDAPEGFEEHVVKVAILAGSLPLTLNVLGSSLRGRNMEYWIDLLPRLQNGIDGKIERTLRVSYDGLSSKEDKAIFHHIACLFNGAKVTYLKLLLADSWLSVNVGLENLADRSLILPSSFQNLHQLGRLVITNCINLETLPTGVNLQYLSELNLRGCSRLRTFPDISTKIEYLFLSETGIEEVPCWIKKFSKLRELRMNGCNKLNSVSLNVFKLGHLYHIDFSDCKAMTGASWIFSGGYLNLDEEALFRKKTFLGCRMWLSGEEVPSYFTHRTTITTATSSSLTIPLLPSSLTQSFLRFRACILFNFDDVSGFKDAVFRFKGSFRNCSDSYNQTQDFCAFTEYYMIYSLENDSRLFVLDCQMSQIPLEMNFDHLDLKIHIVDFIEIKEWGIRILEENCLSADNRLGYPNTPPLPHVSEADMLNEAAECGGK